MGNRWIISRHKFFEHYTYEGMQTELARLRALCPGKPFRVYKVKGLAVVQPNNGWRSLANDPPGQEHANFFIGHSEGGRRDLVFRWPHPKTGKMAFWSSGEDGNYVLDDYGADVWHPAPPPIPGSAVGGIQADREINAAVALLIEHGWKVERPAVEP
jgi:hypothetical protein